MASGSGLRLAPGESFVQCPYHQAHFVTLLTHLDKCRNNYVKEQKAKGKPVEMVACRFNYSHKVPKPEKDYHENICQEANNIIPALMATAIIKPLTEVQRCTTPPSEGEVNDDENWDLGADDAVSNKPGYDPQQKIENECLLYMPRGLTKSERKHYRVDNRKKWIEGESAARMSNPVVNNEAQASGPKPEQVSESYDWDEQ